MKTNNKTKVYGYVRKDGKVGFRNHILVIPASICAVHTAARMAAGIENAVAINHPHGCAQIGKDIEQTKKTLAGLGNNPNVAAVLVVGLGCEALAAESLAKEIKNKPVSTLVIQEHGGTLNTIKKGQDILHEYNSQASREKRVEVDLTGLIVGLECGGSDTTSGLAANPAIGVTSDMVVAEGGTTILSETTELMGAEHIMARRAVNEDVGNDIIRIVKEMEDRAKEMKVDLRGAQPSLGNIEGGLTTIEEKSLGCTYKGGTSPVQEVLAYAQEPTKKGLVIMDTPGYDIESVTGKLAGGAQVVLFTTGRGTPTGSPIAPVIKITGNPETYEKMKTNIDINAGKVISGEAEIEEIGEEIFNEMIEALNGKLTKAEILGHTEVAINRIGPSV